MEFSSLDGNVSPGAEFPSVFSARKLSNILVLCDSFRSSSPEVFHKKGVLKELAKFTGHSSANSSVSESLF